METIVFTKNDKPKSISELFKDANTYVIEKNYDEALTIYFKLKDVVEKDEQKLVWYNIAVIYGKEKKYKDALNIYLELLKNKELKTSFSIDVLINMSEIYGYSKNWQKISDLLDNNFKKYSFEDNQWDYVELAIRYQVALFNLERYDDSEFLFMRLNDKLKRNKHLITYLGRDQRYFLSMGYFFAGEINRLRFESIPLGGSMKNLASILDQKAEFILTAQRFYLKSISFVDRYWATASGYRIGEMYDKFYDQVIKMKIPIKLTFEEKVIYKEELKIRIQNLLKKAINIFESNIEVSERISENNIWIKKTLERLRKAKKKYLEVKKIELENS